ncbi:MAG: hypothetical protein ACW976_01825 [Candidatus Ranarchaeia archaeon]|jgi:hypothetical protein
MTWKIYYNLPESVFRSALEPIKQIFGINLEDDGESIILMGENPKGLVKLRGSLDTDPNGRPIYKIIGIIEKFETLSLLEPHLGAPQQIRVPKPSFLDFAHIVLASRKLSREERMEFLRQNLRFSPVDLEHYIRELKSSALRSPDDPILLEASKLV